MIDRILIRGQHDRSRYLEMDGVAGSGGHYRYEHPQIQAIVISYLDPDQSAEILSNFDEKVRLDIVMQVAALETHYRPYRTERDLEKQFSGGASGQTSKIGGVKRAADIMNFMAESSVEGPLMDSIKEVDNDLGTAIEDPDVCV